MRSVCIDPCHSPLHAPHRAWFQVMRRRHTPTAAAPKARAKRHARGQAAAQGATSPGNDRHHPRPPKAGRVSRGPQVSVTTTTSLRPHAARGGGGGGRRNAGSFCNVCFCNVCFCNVCFCNEHQQRANREHHPSARGRCEGGREGGREEGGGGGDGVEAHGSPKKAMEAQRRPWKPPQAQLGRLVHVGRVLGLQVRKSRGVEAPLGRPRLWRGRREALC